MCVCECECECESPQQRLQRWPNMVWEVTFVGLQISGRALGNLVGETAGKSGCDFVSCEDADSEAMNSDSLIHVPGIQNGGSDSIDRW